MTILTLHEKKDIIACLRAVAQGHFFDDSELSSLLGCDKTDIACLVDSGIEINFYDPINQTIILNALNSLIGYPHNKEEQFSKYEIPRLDELKLLWSKCSSIFYSNQFQNDSAT